MLDLDKESQDIKAVSKEFYVWGQTENSDVKDVSDRLAYLTYVHGSLAATLASALDASRAPLKALRDAEAHMQPKRNIRVNYELQISKLKNEGKPGTEPKIRELMQLLKKAEAQDELLEKEIELLKRKAIVDSETQKWDAIREACLFNLASRAFSHMSCAVWRKARDSFTGVQAVIGGFANSSTDD